ncbi:hypothetical protein H4219_003140 [Mycoemilia scoparia]|uniref:Chitin-binding type-4 domain-containing protein n=1 Tax=Mycoemilia scoparia TaxID=417184 RepID=A0A9W8A0X7_9FUNG|nr:hypothetical protein H4219_003140 [Mycoemilia scoparia]
MFNTTSHIAFTIVALLATSPISTVMGHMRILKPAPREGTTTDPAASLTNGDSKGLCQGLPKGSPIDVQAGNTLSLKFTDGSKNEGAAHGGGHCQFGVSYDGGETFVVVHDEFKHCFKKGPSSDNTPEVTNYDIELPADLPDGEAVFGWVWNNAIGNREFYMNCIDINVTGGGSGFTGPKMVYPNLNDNVTIDEFNGNYDTGMELYDGREEMTVGSGSGSDSGGAKGKSAGGSKGGDKASGSKEAGSSKEKVTNSEANSAAEEEEEKEEKDNQAESSYPPEVEERR